MKIRTLLQTGTADFVNLALAREAFNLVNGPSMPADDQRLFGRLNSGEFSLEDLNAAAGAIRRQTESLNTNADTLTESITNPEVRKMIKGGMLANAKDAVIAMETLVRQVKSALPKHNSCSFQSMAFG